MPQYLKGKTLAPISTKRTSSTPQQKKNDLERARKDDPNKKVENKTRKSETKKILKEKGEDISKVKSLAKSVVSWNIFSMLMKINLFTDWMYGMAVFAAVFKDIVDLIELTGIGYVVVFVMTWLTGLFIYFMMLLGSNSTGRGRSDQQMVKQIITLLIGSAAELVPGLDLLPIETITVIIVLLLVLHDRVLADRMEKLYEKAGA